ncbi:C4-dicarboxylate transporter DctA [Vitiosangium sp. GDMCC 1.1324]|uniref:C4-dicarboxylate transporter DctA n=1 Tax=Vitiosangium sp. (strain GDMCC 1.1324) TaxID=2138576 RepID=UPI000D3A8BDB|nr:C4-dicarboxylate transporter DctA [Vitiosangium sp. GDMCC 1.1324]
MRVLGWLKNLYVQVLVAVVLGALLGHYWPHAGESLKPLGDGFIKLIKMMVAPVVFTTVVTGIAKMGDLKRVGRVGLKAFIYFEVVTTGALALGLLVGRSLEPGAGLSVDVSRLDTKAIESYTTAGKSLSTVDFLANIIPSSLVDPFAKGDILQLLLVALLTSVALSKMGKAGQGILHALDNVGHLLFGMVGIIMRLAPLGALGGIAFTVGKYGVGTLVGLGRLLGTFYATAFLFVLLVLGPIVRWTGVGLFQLLRYLRDELLLVLGTSSSESALPRLLVKLEALGCPQSVVGLVVPMGYSFNLDGTSIYLTLASLFVAQATGTPITLGEELALLAVLLLTSKGAAAVTGGGFITLAATLSATGRIPVAGLVLLLGVDRFMSEARALTNLVGNAVATLVISKWEGGLDQERARTALANPAAASAEPTAAPDTRT